MPIQRLLCFLFLMVTSLISWGQSTTPNSLEPGKRKSHFAPHREGTARFHKTKVKHTARYEFYKRVEKAAREKQRILKKLSKDQFADPRFFGHKRLPRRHPSYKMRYCPECGIRH